MGSGRVFEVGSQGPWAWRPHNGLSPRERGSVTQRTQENGQVGEGKLNRDLLHLLDIKMGVERGKIYGRHKAVGGVTQSGFRASFKNQEYFPIHTRLDWPTCLRTVLFLIAHKLG